MPASAAIFGCQGMELLEKERGFFRDAQPLGFILFARNCRTPGQVRKLCADLRESVDDDAAPILIDQEGGRVARLKPPHWRARPPARRFGKAYEDDPEAALDAAYLETRLIAAELAAVGINVDCAPVLDVPVKDAHDIIGDRAYSEDVAAVIELGRAAIRGFLDGGVLPVIKHIPGHGRAEADSHEQLPRVRASAEELRKQDFIPFESLKDAPMGMTAHVVYEAFDGANPATTSTKLVGEIIRSEIGFDGFLMTDDLSMKALEGPVASRARRAIAAGCDAVLHCNGKMEEMIAIANAVPNLTEQAERRLAGARAQLKARGNFDVAESEAKLAEFLGAAT
jgi:beta-N-acetylhexosaminidase